MTSDTLNPLLDLAPLPDFAGIRPAHVAPAIDTLLQAASAALESVTGDTVPAEYDPISAVLDVATERMSRAWGAVSHLNAVADTPESRAAYSENLPKVTEFQTRIGADERLYAKYKAVLRHTPAAALSAPRRQALSNTMRDFVLGGAELHGAARLRFAQIKERQAELSQRFSEHVLDATDAYALYADAQQVAGLPADVLQAAQAAAVADGREGFKITLQYPSYGPVMQYAQDRSLRQQLQMAYQTRASELGPPELDNSEVMRETLKLSQEEARLLGHANFAELSLVPKMAESPAQVIAFLRDLAARARPFAERDLAELRDFARTELNLPDLESWDISFASERLKEQRYAFSDQEVKAYFTEPKVLQGMFRVVETLFGISIHEDSAAVWHPTVRFYRIERQREGIASIVGHFYLDLYARPGKRSGAWMDEVCGRWARPEGRLQTPVAHLVCNFAAPVKSGDAVRPALLTHDDVITLFHEFGHGLHHLLTQVDDIGVAGMSGVEWDAVELPSQFMENFCWEWDVVKEMSAHVDSGEALPRALFDRMLAAKNFQSGLLTLRQIEYGLVDMRLHAEPGAEDRIQQIVDEVRREVSIMPTADFNRFQHAFLHIFAGGYSAGFYSYKWAELLSADAWSAFEEHGVLDATTGRRYLEAILEAGGSRPAIESFRAFRGREPRIDAMLRHQGMA